MRELGLLDKERKKASLELGWKDPTGAKDVAETVNDAKVFFVMTLTSKQPTEAIYELMAEVAAEQTSTGLSSESVLDSVLLRRIQNARNQFPRTFTVEEAFLANSHSIHPAKMVLHVASNWRVPRWWPWLATRVTRPATSPIIALPDE